MLKEKNRMVLAISRLSKKKRATGQRKKNSKTISFGYKRLENFRKRVTRDKKEVHRYAQDEVFKALLEVADNLERATQIDLGEATKQERAWQKKSLRVLI